jgi:hypothetical protein
MDLMNQTSEEASRTEEPISLEQIAFLTDFPEDFIKKELLLEGVTEITMSEFRQKVLDYLERSMDLVS